jgi:hypothetical protein
MSGDAYGSGADAGSATRELAPLTFVLHRPYFDLQAPLSPTAASTTVFAPLHRYRDLEAGEPLLGVAGTVPPAFRTSLLRQSGLSAYASIAPGEADPSVRTPEWEALCECTARYRSLPLERQALVAALWGSLGFHGLVLKHAQEFTNQELAGSRAARLLALTVSLSRSMVGAFDAETLERLFAHAPRTASERFIAGQRLAFQRGRVMRDPAALSHVLAELRQFVDADRDDSFRGRLRKGQVLLVASFFPFLVGDHSALVARRQEALEAAFALTPTNVTETVVARAHIVAVLEHSAWQEAERRDGESADSFTAFTLRVEPTHVPARMRLANSLSAQGLLDAAAGEFLRAARVGPPGTALCFYHAGKSLEAAGAIEQAVDAYARALAIEATPALVARVRRLGEILADPALSDWCTAAAGTESPVSDLRTSYDQARHR